MATETRTTYETVETEVEIQLCDECHTEVDDVTAVYGKDYCDSCFEDEFGTSSANIQTTDAPTKTERDSNSSFSESITLLDILFGFCWWPLVAPVLLLKYPTDEFDRGYTVASIGSVLWFAITITVVMLL